ncbi:MAG: hypothetical protein LLG20_22980, partial [Acidobacteriales bacterium]|nr:hypothetical protein [Terriglobales bacterium]
MAQYAAGRYALILEDPPVSSQITGHNTLRTAAAMQYAQQVEARQQSLVRELAGRGITATSRVSTLANAVFVAAPKSRVAELQSLP